MKRAFSLVIISFWFAINALASGYSSGGGGLPSGALAGQLITSDGTTASWANSFTNDPRSNSVWMDFRGSQNQGTTSWIHMHDYNNNAVSQLDIYNNNGTYDGSTLGIENIFARKEIAVTEDNAAAIPLYIIGASGQTAHMIDVNSFGNTGGNLFFVTAAGNATLYNKFSTYELAADVIGNRLSNTNIQRGADNSLKFVNAGNSDPLVDITATAGQAGSALLQLIGAASFTGDHLSVYANDGSTKIASISSTGAINGFSLSVGAGTYGIASTGAAALASVKTGANGSTLTAVKTGTVTLSSGSNTISDTDVTANTVIMVTEKTSTPILEQFGYSVSAGSGFTVYSNNVASTAVVSYVEYVK